MSHFDTPTPAGAKTKDLACGLKITMIRFNSPRHCSRFVGGINPVSLSQLDTPADPQD
jgi:hypothetical protein